MDTCSDDKEDGDRSTAKMDVAYRWRRTGVPVKNGVEANEDEVDMSMKA